MFLKIKILKVVMIFDGLNKPVWLLKVLIMGCGGVSKMECWCVWSGHWAVDTEDSGIMKHNAGRAGAFCRINPKLHPKPSEHPPGKGLGGGGWAQGQVHDLWPRRVWVWRRGETGGWTWLLVASLCSPPSPALLLRRLILAKPPSIIQQTY